MVIEYNSFAFARRCDVLLDLMQSIVALHGLVRVINSSGCEPDRLVTDSLTVSIHTEIGA